MAVFHVGVPPYDSEGGAGCVEEDSVEETGPMRLQAEKGRIEPHHVGMYDPDRLHRQPRDILLQSTDPFLFGLYRYYLSAVVHQLGDVRCLPPRRGAGIEDPFARLGIEEVR